MLKDRAQSVVDMDRMADRELLFNAPETAGLDQRVQSNKDRAKKIKLTMWRLKTRVKSVQCTL